MDLEQLIDAARDKAAAAGDLAGLDAVESELTGRSSPIAEARRQLGEPLERPCRIGEHVNMVREWRRRFIRRVGAAKPDERVEEDTAFIDLPD